MKKTAPRISDQAANFLPGIFNSINQGCEYIIDAFPLLYRRAVESAKSQFSKNELALMIDVFNGTMLTAQIAGQMLSISIQDGIKYENLAEKWGIDENEIIKKSQALSDFERACLEIWANGYWYSKKSVEESKRDFWEYIKNL